MEERPPGLPTIDVLKRPAFSTEEYDRRLREVRWRMSAKGIDCLLIHSFPNICYLTGLETVAPHKYFMLAVPLEGELALLCQTFESHNALLAGCVCALITYDLNADYVAASRDLLVSRGWPGRRLGIEFSSAGLRASDCRRLTESLAGSCWVDGSGLLDDVKTVKSEAELYYLRQAAQWSSRGMQAATEAVAEGATDNDVAAAAYRTLIEAGSEYMCYAPIVTSGRRSGIPHSTHQRVRIAQGDPVLIEIGACCRRYSAPIMRTASAGVPRDEVKKLAEIADAGVSTVIENMRPGALAGEIALKAKTRIQGISASTIWHGYYGYSVGIGFPPEWSDSPAAIREGSALVLEPGMVFHCSTSFREIGQWGVAISETVAVTADGCEVFTSFPRALAVR
jgi:Xaa-Pro dipeptidase